MKSGTQANMIYRDYVNILTPNSTKDLQFFGVKNLNPLIDNCWNDIMSIKDEFLNCLNLIEFELPLDYHNDQLHILNVLADNLTEGRASDALEKNIIQRILRALSFQPQTFQITLQNLLKSIMVKVGYKIDIPSIISIILSPYTKLHDFALEILATISDPNIIDQNGYEIQFENHIKFILELSLSKKKSYEFKNLALKTIAHLAMKDNLKPQIMYNRGIDTLIYHLRNEENLEGQRHAAKGLLNLSINSRKLTLLNSFLKLMN